MVFGQMWSSIFCGLTCTLQDVFFLRIWDAMWVTAYYVRLFLNPLTPGQTQQTTGQDITWKFTFVTATLPLPFPCSQRLSPTDGLERDLSWTVRLNKAFCYYVAFSEDCFRFRLFVPMELVKPSQSRPAYQGLWKNRESFVIWKCHVWFFSPSDLKVHKYRLFSWNFSVHLILFSHKSSFYDFDSITCSFWTMWKIQKMIKKKRIIINNPTVGDGFRPDIGVLLSIVLCF